MKFEYYQASDRIFVNLSKTHNSYSGLSDLSLYTINNKPLIPTHNKLWHCVMGETEVKSVQKLQPPTLCNRRFEIINDKFVTDGVPATLTFDDVGLDVRDGYSVWTNPTFAEYRSLYNECSDTTDEYYADIDVEAVIIGNISVDAFNVPVVKYAVLKDPMWTATHEIDLSAIVRYEDLATILTDPALIHHQPCVIPSKQLYEIIRHYVKTNINSAVAEVTSDYAFCLGVSKRISIKPYTTTREEKKDNGKSYKYPRFITNTTTFRKMPVFEMTSTDDNYKGYTPISALSGDSLVDIADRLSVYLTDLMDHINAPLSDCAACDGTGICDNPELFDRAI